MTTISWQRKSGFFFVLLILIAFGACKKSKAKPEPEPDPPSSGSNVKQTPTTNRTELSNDSLFLYAKEIYYWNDALPAYDDFEPRKYGSNYQSELFAITQIKIDPSTSKPYEYRTSNPSFPKYSYIEDITTRNPVAAIAALPNEQADVDLEGNGNDIGIYSVFAVSQSQSSYRLYVLAVDKGSPADIQGITRGAYITKINGTDIGSSANFETRDRALINSTIFGDPSSLSLTVVKTNGATFTGALNKTSYNSNPVYKTNVLTAGGKKIGYLAYARFSNESNSVTVLTNIFNDFYAQGVTDLVIDLRYNGGGYISTAQHLVNLIAPSSATGVMYKEYFNATMQNDKAKIMKNQPYLDANDKVQYKNGRMMNYFDDISYTVDKNTYSFSKKGNLTAVTNVVFLVSGSTASASELVINSLKPKMNVKLVGTKTYGKPIGFFPVRIENKYDIFFSMFETKNAIGEGGYYSGMAADVTGEKDYGDYDFGDPADDYLAKAIKILAPGAAAVSVASKNKVMSVSPDLGLGSSQTALGGFNVNKEFVGMIEDRPKSKP
jgi:carboxyl-terminal processing protease